MRSMPLPARPPMTLKPLLLALLLAIPAIGRANDLLRFYSLAVKNDAGIRAAGFARDAALEARPQARATLLPQITGSYERVFNDSDLKVSYTDPATGTVVPISSKNDGVDKNLSVTLTQSLFNLESYYRLKEVDQQVALALLSYQSSEQSLLLRVAESYFGTLAASDSLRSATAEKDALARQLELAKQNVEVGISSLTDTEETQARYDLSVATELEAQQSYTSALESLEEITREPIEDINQRPVRVVPLSGSTEKKPLATLPEDLQLPLPQPASAEQWVVSAKLGSLDVMSARLGFTAAEQQMKAAQSRHLPTLSGSVSYTDSSSEAGALPTQLKGPSAGIRLSLPIFAGGATQSAVRQAAATKAQRLAEFDGAERSVEGSVRTAYQAVLLGAARVKALRQAQNSSRSALIAVETGLEIGTRAAVDVLNAQQQRYAAERNFAQARYDYLMATLRLKALAGRLALRDLEAVDAMLVN